MLLMQGTDSKCLLWFLKLFGLNCKSVLVIFFQCFMTFLIFAFYFNNTSFDIKFWFQPFPTNLNFCISLCFWHLFILWCFIFRFNQTIFMHSGLYYLDCKNQSILILDFLCASFCSSNFESFRSSRLQTTATSVIDWVKKSFRQKQNN